MVIYAEYWFTDTGYPTRGKCSMAGCGFFCLFWSETKWLGAPRRDADRN